ncbi:hypothetical protein [Serratia sp. UGAL515B_01]|uniref:hypothetical protein n=1 Tax=Serratia sp. UGAL515B_01 TaxID=2986763 RepID=UPI002952C2C5|nr:hypothetical protein [Serratia sp. UGAL515B_01]WON76970.1 hypothetical protein OK023_17645 [Serratia sp. UGAL515B_01]
MTYPLNKFYNKRYRITKIPQIQHGFSLIEVALFLIIVIVIVISVTPFIKLTSYEYKTVSTVKRTEIIASAVSLYLSYHKVDLANNIIKMGKPQEIPIDDLISEGFLPTGNNEFSKDTFGNNFHVIARLVPLDSSAVNAGELMVIITALNENKVKDIPVDMRGEIVSMLGINAGIEPLSGNKSEIYGVSRNWTVHLQDWSVPNIDYKKAQYFYFIESKNTLSNDTEIYKTEADKISKISFDSNHQSSWAPVFTEDKLLISMKDNPDIDYFQVSITPSTDKKPRNYQVLGEKLSINPEPEWLPIGNQNDVKIMVQVSAHHLSGMNLVPVTSFTLNIKAISIEDYFHSFFVPDELTVKGWALERHPDSKLKRVNHCNTQRDIQVTKVIFLSIKSIIQDDFTRLLLKPLTLEVSAIGDKGIYNIIYRKFIINTGDLKENITDNALQGDFDISNNTCASYLEHQVQYDVELFSGEQSWKMNSVKQNWSGQNSAFSTKLFP